MPFLNHPGIARLANFTISSQVFSSLSLSLSSSTPLIQVFHYTELKFSPQRSKSGGYYVSSSSLPPMISSVESKLGLFARRIII